jgi:uncharacterized protein YbjT (DUF2867 family)
MTIAFVAGATGYTGRSVVAELRAQGMATVAHVRPDSPSLEQWRERFGALGAEVDTTPWDCPAMTEALRRRRVNLVFALLGTTRRRARASRAVGGPEADYEAVDYRLTAILYAAATGVRPTPRFIYLSSLGAREDTPNDYLRVRGRVERLLREGNLPFTIVRPSFITGSDRDEPRPGERIAATLLDGVLAVAGAAGLIRLRDRYRSMTGAQLAEVLVRVARDPDQAGRTLSAEQLR